MSSLRLSHIDKKEILRQYSILTNTMMLSRENISEEFPYSIRDDYQRDYGRVLYSPSFRRLQGCRRHGGGLALPARRVRLRRPRRVAGHGHDADHAVEGRNHGYE